MPKGVEHVKMEQVLIARKHVSSSVMPKGVEHAERLYPARQGNYGVEFSDAERR